MTSVVNILSANLTSLEASPPVHVPVQYMGGRERAVFEICTIGATDTSGSTYRFFDIPTNAVITSLRKLSIGAQTSSTAFDVGLFNVAGGAAVLGTAYATGLDIHVADTTGTQIMFQNRAVSALKQQVWQDAGLSADPGGFLQLVATAQTIGTVGGSLAFFCSYTVD